MLDDGFSVAPADGPLDPFFSQAGAASLGRAAGASPIGGSAGMGGSPAGSGGGSAGAGLEWPSCSNGSLDPGELSIDCGGVCGACVGCSWGSFGEPEQVMGLGFSAQSDQWGPTLSADALTLMLSSVSSGGTEDLYLATRADRSSVFAPAAALLGLDTTTADEGTPFLSVDGLSLYFYSTQPGGLGNRDIYVSKRASLLAEFESPSLAGGVNSPNSDHMPWLPADELSMYFTSTRPGGMGGYDLWLATRADRVASFGDLRRLSELSTSSNDEGASLTADELTIFFTSNRPGGAGGNDLYMAQRASKSGAFGGPVIVPGVNTADDELNVAVTADGSELFFSSDRETGTHHVIWRASRSCD